MGVFQQNSLTWEQQEVMRLLKSQPGTAYQESDETQRTIFRSWIRDLLLNSAITVTFVKADGAIRNMLCTLDPDRIPPQPPRADKPAKALPVDGLRQDGILGKDVTRPEESHTQKVWDLEAGAWRSFRYDRLKKVSAEIRFE
jgi:hypothetical protein